VKRTVPILKDKEERKKLKIIAKLNKIFPKK